MLRLILALVLSFVSVGCDAKPNTLPEEWPKYRLRGANINSRLSLSDLKTFKEWGANSVRLLFLDIMRDEAPYKRNEDGLKRIERTVEMSKQLGLYFILSLNTANANPNRLFGNPKLKEAYIQLWRELTIKYKDNRQMAFDVFNEPSGEMARKHWNSYARELTAEIRKIDPKRVIIIEPPDWGWPGGFKYLKPTGDRNTIYSFHFYGPMDFTHLRGHDANGRPIGHLRVSEAEWKKRVYPGNFEGQFWDKEKLAQSIEPAMEWAKKHNVAMWCGEFGVARWAKGATNWMSDMIKVMEDAKVGWAYYSYREWHAMDIEMDPNVRNRKTKRSNTPLVKIMTEWLSKNDPQKP